MELNHQIMNKKKIYTILFMFLVGSTVYSQKCKVFNTGQKSYYFSGNGIIAESYKQVVEDSMNFNALLITKNGLTNKAEVTHISVDSLGCMIIESLSDDSVVFKSKQKVTKDDIKILFEMNSLNGFYESVCESVSSHETQVLIVSNYQNKKWVELTCFDGRIESVLKDNEKELSYLYNIYSLLFKRKLF